MYIYKLDLNQFTFSVRIIEYLYFFQPHCRGRGHREGEKERKVCQFSRKTHATVAQRNLTIKEIFNEDYEPIQWIWKCITRQTHKHPHFIILHLLTADIVLLEGCSNPNIETRPSLQYQQHFYFALCHSWVTYIQYFFDIIISVLSEAIYDQWF